MLTLSVVVCMKKVTEFKRGRAPGWGVRGARPPEAEILLAVGRLMEAANVPVFLIFANAENYRYLCCLVEITFNKSHLDMCMVTREHFITIKIFPGGQPGWAKARAQDGNCLPWPPLAPSMSKIF